MSNKSNNPEEKNKKINNNNEKKKKNKEKKKKSVFKKIMYVLLVLITILGGLFTYKVCKNGGGLTGIVATVVGHDTSTKKDLKDFKCLILGISTDQKDVNLTDTIMVASYNPNTQKASLMSVPRDTFVGLNPAKATPYDKINALYSRNNRPDETLEAVNRITGLDIKYYVVVKTEALIDLVNVIGGVTYNVPIDMYYTDKGQDLEIDLKAGEQEIDGDKAEQLLRFRKNNNGTTYPESYGANDTGRMRTQREFIEATAKELLKPENIFKINDIVDVAVKNVITNINLDDVKNYIPYAIEFNLANLDTDTLPGTNTNKNTSGTWIYLINKEKSEKMVDKMFISRDIIQDGTTVDMSEIEMNVLNGTGMNTKLKEVVNKIENADCTVLSEGNTNPINATTIICNESVSEQTINNIKTVLGIGEIKISKSSDSDITLIVGEDYIK